LNKQTEGLISSPVYINTLADPAAAMEEGFLNPVVQAMTRDDANLFSSALFLQQLGEFTDPVSGFTFIVDANYTNNDQEQSIGMLVNASRIYQVYSDLSPCADALGVDIEEDNADGIHKENTAVDIIFGMKNDEYFIIINGLDITAGVEATLADINLDLGLLEAIISDSGFSLWLDVSVGFPGEFNLVALEALQPQDLEVTINNADMQAALNVPLLTPGATGQFYLAFTDSNLFDSNLPELEMTGSVNIPEFTLGEVLVLQNLNLSFDQNELMVSADSASLAFEDVMSVDFTDTTDDADTVAISGVYNLLEDHFTLTADIFDFLIPELLTINATNIEINYDLNAPASYQPFLKKLEYSCTFDYSNRIFSFTQESF